MILIIDKGEQLRDQVEERLKFYDTGDAPRKNVDVMGAVAESLRKIAAKNDPKGEKKDKKKKRDREVEAIEEEVVVDDGEKKKKKKKVCSQGLIRIHVFFFTGI
jgi:nucleolar protein 56